MAKPFVSYSPWQPETGRLGGMGVDPACGGRVRTDFPRHRGSRRVHFMISQDSTAPEVFSDAAMQTYDHLLFVINSPSFDDRNF